MMKRLTSPAIMLLAFFSSTNASAEAVDCGSIVQETVTELRLGAASWWSEDVEKMAGMAAMTACFKAAADATYKSDSQEGAISANASSQEAASSQTNSASTLTFRPLSGSASKKPYERARARKDPK